MKTLIRFLAAPAALLLPFSACQDLFRIGPEPSGTLIISLDAPRGALTRGDALSPDVGTFLLSVTDASGKNLYDGTYAYAPDELDVPAGTYTVSAVSAAFNVPAFDAPQWGDTQVVTVTAGGSVAVTLICRQLNSGLRLEVDASFRQAFPSGKLILQDAYGHLPYGYEETRTAFFRPGAVSLTLDDGGSAQPLFTRTLEERQILTLHLAAREQTRSGGIAIQVDTSRTWLTGSFVVGSAGASEPGNAYDVAAARTHAGEQGVWVQGYLVGVATNTGKVSFAPPFTKNTNLVLGAKASTSDIAHCLSVELRAGELRQALNLQDHPELLGRKVYIRGDLVSAYYGIPGLKAPSAYQWQ